MTQQVVIDEIRCLRESLAAAEARVDMLAKALKTLGVTDEGRIEWLAEGKRPGTVGWAMKVIAEARDAKAVLVEEEK